MTTERLIKGKDFEIGNGRAWLVEGNLYLVYGGGTAYIKRMVEIEEVPDIINFLLDLNQTEAVDLLEEIPDFKSTFIYDSTNLETIQEEIN